MQHAAEQMLEDVGKGALVLPPECSRLVKSLFESLTASPIGRAYFALRVEVGDLNEADMAIHKALRRQVDEYIQVRNEVVHADWSVGWAIHETGEAIPPTAHKIRTRSWRTSYQNLHLSASKVRMYAGQISYVSSLLRVFGQTCRARQCGEVSERPSNRLALHSEGEGAKALRLVRHMADSAPHLRNYAI